MSRTIQFFIDEINELLPFCLWQLALSLTQGVHIKLHLMEFHLEGYRDELYRTMCWYAFQQGYYQSVHPPHIPFLIHPNVSEPDLRSVRDYIVCPQSYSVSDKTSLEEGLMLKFSETSLGLMDQLEEHNQAQFLEEMLFNAISAHHNKPSPILWFTEQTLERELNTFLSEAQSSPQSIWQNPALNKQLRCFIDMAPLRSPDIPQKIRTHLDQLIRNALRHPEDENSQILLSMLGRRLSNDFPEPRHSERLIPPNKAIQILKPIQDWTVSIIVVTYNRLNFLKRNLQGILDQTYPHWQLIVIDHASTDGSSAFLQELAQGDQRIQVIHKQTNQGHTAVIQYYQQCLSQIQTELILISPDDDWMSPSHLAELVAMFQERPWIAMAFSSYDLVEKSGETRLHYGPLYAQSGVSNPYIELQRALHTGICVQGALIRKEALKAFVQWDPLKQAGYSYGIFDSLISIYLQCLFEAVHSTERTYSVTFDSQSTNALDCNWNGRWWLSIIQAITRCFDRLYRIEDCPYDKALQHYYRLILDSTLLKIQEAMKSPIEIDLQSMRENQSLLQDLVDFCAQDLSRLSQNQENLFKGKNAFSILIEEQ